MAADFHSKKYLCVFLIIFVLLFFSGPKTYAKTSGLTIDDDPSVPWKIVADSIEYDEKTDTYIASKKVVLKKGNKSLMADIVRFDRKNMTASATGHVIMNIGEDTLSGQKITINLKDGTGILYEGTIFVKKSHFYIKGEELKKTGKKEYKAYKARVTTCDGPSPDWEITGKNVSVNLEGYGTVMHGTFRIKGVPVFYTPFFLFPVNKDRKTGLLIPEIGQSDRKGLEYSQPFYWAINENSDATLYGHYMSKRGFKTGLEYRYVLDYTSKGAIMFDFLDDRKIDDGKGTSGKDWGYEDDRELRPNTDRYWLRLKADQALFRGVKSRLDLDIVSDQDYLKEFKGGFSGYDKTKTFYQKYFHRDIDDYTDPVRENSLNFNKIWSSASFNADFIWYDNVINRRWKDKDPTLHQLPFMTFNTSKQRIGGTPFYWNLDSEYSWFFRTDGPRNHRIDFYPRIYFPKKFKKYLFIEPSLGFRQTLWYADKTDETSISKDRFFHREIFDGKLDLFTRLGRTYELSPGGLKFPPWPEKIRHNIKPRIIYEYLPDVHQTEYPFSDSLDRIWKKNRITFALVNTFISKSKIKTDMNKNSTEPENYEYRQFCRFELRQSYDFNNYDFNEETLKFNIPDRSTPEGGKHFSTLYGRLDITPAGYFSVKSDFEWSHKYNRMKIGNLGMSIWDDRGDRLFSDYRYTRDISESIYSNFLLNITRNLSAYMEYERNLKDKEDIKAGIGFLYKSKCWSVKVNYMKERDDHSYGIMINLYGLGGIKAN